MTHIVLAELVSSVFKIVVEPGDRVQAGDTLVILESMKMEIPVLSEWSGTVSEIAVSEGDVISEGDTIAVVDTA
jgi:biotin carboxyl carrier protein